MRMVNVMGTELTAAARAMGRSCPNADNMLGPPSLFGTGTSDDHENNGDKCGMRERDGR
jgi:hypothetical protein